MSACSPSETRRGTFAALAVTAGDDAAPLDLLVAGGGIVGAGVARDAAMRGMRVALVEARDFAFGTSSRSSRLLHGGLRYLEQGRVGLVHEASVEKKTVHAIAPHLGEPLGFIFPVYAGGRPMWQMRLGVKIYDLLCNGRNFRPSRGFTAAETVALLPQIATNGLRGSVRYYDALTNDARLVIDTLRSAAAAGARVLNYAPLLNASRDSDGKTWLCEIGDTAPGTGGDGTGTAAVTRVRARAILNAAGPWAEHMPRCGVKLRLTKGVHIVVPRDRLTVGTGEAVTLVEGKRILFVIPWGERLVIGTTDTDYDGDPATVAPDAADIDYILRAANATFPAAALAPADVIGAWAGVRPLIANRDGSPSDTSRAHKITNPDAGWWDIAGGKLTTYRLMAEQAVDKIARFLETTGGGVGGGAKFRPCRTAAEPLLPAGDPAVAAGYTGIVPPPVTPEAVRHYVANEWALTVEDIVVRRAGWLHYHRDFSAHEPEIARWLAAATATTTGA
ncbi:MAG: glycerol-3-phosphate dehydrogenase/oxidase [Puniceicoccales bacterium]|jgi:glycerol-3-phosphate dehydrogenase|nr:glycerol-3-phosphate dehydrogenase/oxidase [Puniceicoccales bacterium]